MVVPQNMIKQYQDLYESLIENKNSGAAYCVGLIKKGRDRYVAASNQTGLPWYFIAVCHLMECSCDFTKHIHNGDPLSARTVQVPKQRPVKGDPPFTWEQSVQDWVELMKYNQIKDWSVPQILYLFEKNNGFGYRNKGINTPYLWAGSQHYIKGKFTSDGKFDANAVSKQTGAAVVLKKLLS